jgi:hypothetical protein
MPTTLTVTAGAEAVTLDSARQGKVTLSVANGGAQAARVRSYVAAEGAASADWFTIEGQPVRDIAPGAPESFVVSVSVPADAPAGSYAFRLNVVGVDNPDEEFASSPPVGFTVSAAKARPPVKKGYIEALAGGLVGAFAGGALGVIPALLFILTTGEPADLSEIIGTIFCFAVLAIVGAPLGIWIGASVGTWAGLKWRGCEYSRRTGLLTALLLLILLVVVGFILGAIDIENDTISQIVSVFAAAVAVAGAAVGARAVVLLLTTKEL